MKLLSFLRRKGTDEGQERHVAGTVLTGDVCYVRVYAQIRPTDLPIHRLLMESEMRGELQRATRELLGSEFEVRSMTVGRGSVEILVLIGTALYVISRYKNFVESIELLLAQFRRIALLYFESQGVEPTELSATWSPGPALAAAMTATPVNSAPRTLAEPLLLVYLILSHAVLLAVALWLLIDTLSRP